MTVDIGDHKAVRMAWKDYLNNIGGVVFLVDTEDQSKSRFEEVRESQTTVCELAKRCTLIKINHNQGKILKVTQG